MKVNQSTAQSHESCSEDAAIRQRGAAELLVPQGEPLYALLDC